MRDWEQIKAEELYQTAINCYIAGQPEQAKEYLGKLKIRALDAFIETGGTVEKYLKLKAEEQCEKEIAEAARHLSEFTRHKNALGRYERVIEENNAIKRRVSDLAKNLNQ